MACLKKIPMVSLAIMAGGLAISSSVFAQGEAISADEFLQQQNQENNTAAVQGSSVSKPRELSVVEKGIEEAKAELANKEVLAKKIALAREMHQIRPTRVQVDSAVMRASLVMPVRERQPFIDAMKGMLNYNAIERISIDAMIETYTLKELDSMVKYYSKPEAKSASDKISNWASVVQPEVVNMIDKAMMRIRAGQ